MIAGMMEISGGTFALNQNGNLMENGNLLTMSVRFSATIAERTTNMSGMNLFKVEKGQIIEICLFSEDQNAEDIFWSM